MRLFPQNDEYTCILCSEKHRAYNITTISYEFLFFYLKSNKAVKELSFLIDKNICDNCAATFKFNPKVQEAKFKYMLGLL